MRGRNVDPFQQQTSFRAPREDTPETDGVSRRSLMRFGAVGAATVLASPLGMAPQSAAQDATPGPMGSFTVETDILYGEPDQTARVLDVYRPPTRDTPRAAVIVIHGGGYTEGWADRTYVAGIAEKLAEAGYVAFNITYRLMNGEPGHNVWPAQLDDVQRAVRWVRANADEYGVNPDQIAALGHSAGAHLANLLGVRETNEWDDPTADLYSSRVNAVIDLAGDADLSLPGFDIIGNQLPSDLLGGTVEEVPGAYRDASPITWINANAAPFLIIQGASDDAVSVENAWMLAEALHAASVDFVHVEVAKWDHYVPVLWENCGPWVLTFLATRFPSSQEA